MYWHGLNFGACFLLSCLWFFQVGASATAAAIPASEAAAKPATLAAEPQVKAAAPQAAAKKEKKVKAAAAPGAAEAAKKSAAAAGKRRSLLEPEGTLYDGQGHVVQVLAPLVFAKAFHVVCGQHNHIIQPRGSFRITAYEGYQPTITSYY